MKTLELHYPMIQFLIIYITLKLANVCISIEPDHVKGNAELEEKARLTMKSNFRSSVSMSYGCIRIQTESLSAQSLSFFLYHEVTRSISTPPG